jgi:hypothetical protein
LSSTSTTWDKFNHENVIAGKYRVPQSDAIRLDPIGEKRYVTFLDSNESKGAPPSFDDVVLTAQKYAFMFGNLSGERAPWVIYVGAPRPLVNMCTQWSAALSSHGPISGSPKVFGLVLARENQQRIPIILGQRGP